MTWTTAEAACVSLKISRATLDRRIGAQEIPAKKEGKARLVWIGPDPLLIELTEIRSEIAALREELVVQVEQVRKPKPAPTTSPTTKKRSSAPPRKSLHAPWTQPLLDRIAEEGGVMNLARKLGVSHSCVSRWKAGRRKPPAEIRELLERSAPPVDPTATK